MTSDEARARLQADGPNELPEAPPTPLWKRIARQFRSALIYLLLLALAFDLGLWMYEGASGAPVEAIAIFAILCLNAALGALQEFRSEKALSQLKALSSPQCWVLRDGQFTRVPSRELVVGDTIRLEGGDRVPADGKIQSLHSLAVDESVLTGESVPVDKSANEELLSGTLVVRGSATAEVTATGPRSTMGKLAGTLSSIEAGKTPLERRIDVFGSLITRYVVIAVVVLIALGLLVEGTQRVGEVVMFAVALAVAVVPEGMPAMLTLSLALGVQRMARRHAVVRRLAAVEALGSVTVIATDKTGTLTENRMTVGKLHALDDVEALRAMVIANDADHAASAGDPLELALLKYASEHGVDIRTLADVHPRLSERPFDSSWKYMRATVAASGNSLSYLKGAIEVLLERSTLSASERTNWLERAEIEAARGFRVIALAVADGESDQQLRFLGFVTLWDPPRPEVHDAVQKAHSAGIRVLVITGDHPSTARAVAGLLGIKAERVLTGADLERFDADELARALREVHVFARTNPEHKLRIVNALQASGEIVAMTGDGVNDAPALKRSDVGIAMGQRGSDVAREVSDLVLTDDNFATIVAAIEEGRVIYDNIQKFIRFTFSTNVALVFLIMGAVIGSLALDLRGPTGALLLPLTALQILWINFLGDGPPALALALDRNLTVMADPPRAPDSKLLDARSLRFILSVGVVQGAIGLLLLLILPALGNAVVATQTGVFLYESVAKLVSAYPARKLAGTTHANWHLHAAVFVGVTLQLMCVFVPALRDLLHLQALDAETLLIIVGCVIATMFASQGFSSLFGSRRKLQAPTQNLHSLGKPALRSG